jgi:hypothetical protein
MDIKLAPALIDVSSFALSISNQIRSIIINLRFNVLPVVLTFNYYLISSLTESVQKIVIKGVYYK